MSTCIHLLPPEQCSLCTGSRALTFDSDRELGDTPTLRVERYLASGQTPPRWLLQQEFDSRSDESISTDQLKARESVRMRAQLTQQPWIISSRWGKTQAIYGEDDE